jgi:hypothetical protein
MKNQKDGFNDISEFEILKKLVTPETGGDVIINTFVKLATARAVAVTSMKYGHIGHFIGTPEEATVKAFHASMMVGSIMHLMEELGLDPNFTISDVNIF